MISARSFCLLAVLGLSGCGFHGAVIDLTAITGARAGLTASQDTFQNFEDEKPEPEAPPSKGSVIVGELLAFFPGLFVHGLGHFYAGDYKTASKIQRIGEFGYLMTAVGGGLGVGGYFLDKSDNDSFALGLYVSGGTFAVVGVSYILTAWFYDMIDTPRAVRTGGEPPPRSAFVDAMDIFD